MPKPTVPCGQCGALTTNKRYCSRRCNMLLSNKLYPRTSYGPKPHPRVCAWCNQGFTMRRTTNGIVSRSKYCPDCLKSYRLKRGIYGRTKGEVFASRTNWQSARTAIQKKARAAYLHSGREKQCAICGYDKHVEVSHIKPVSSFSDDTIIAKINHIDNLVALCPNHHWEHDNGLLDLRALGEH